jgi:glutamate dehydrogenase
MATGKPADAKGLIDELTDSLRDTAEAVVPWFLKHMPPMYFQDTDHATQLSHLRAIIAAKGSGRPIELALRNEDGSQWTLMRPLDYPGVLAELVSVLPTDRPLRAAKIHTATDGQLVVDTFEFGEAPRFDPNDPEQAAKLRQTIEYVQKEGLDWPAAEIADYFTRCSGEYVLTLTPLRIYRHRELFLQVTGTDATAVSLERESDPTLCRIVAAAGNSSTRGLLERIARRLSRSSVNIHRAYLDTIDDRANGSIVVLGFVVQGPDGGPIHPQRELWQSVSRDLTRIKWFDQRVLDLAYATANLGMTRAEVIVALCDLVHQALIKTNAYAFNLDRIAKFARRHIAQATKIADLLLDRFNPAAPLPDDAFESRSAGLRGEIESAVDHQDARIVLGKLLDAVRAVYRTNVALPDRWALSLRIDPALLATPERPDVPYGVFFVHGRLFNGFHVRFRDIARGGVRAIRPMGVDQHARENERLYDEAYGLAYAQQLKNKDIPEGGAKAAILLDPTAELPRSVKAFVDAVLDLITPDPATRAAVVDRFGKDELLYLGPDENITPQLIEWIVDRAKRRGYPIPNAFMSSKPGAGINHKEYGVTSEGVTVFLDVALRSIGINPDAQSFTVKLTGGPDGDVAGNEIRILHRDYGDRARFVGIADGSGSAEDPDGLSHEELLRLFHAGLPVAHFHRARLGPRGRVVPLDHPEGVQLRSTLHNRVVADAFIPAGGRPNTIHQGNWRDFLKPDGTVSSRVIVEGANLFLTPEARRHLSQAGALIVKDSSANKCGVICSSFEIAACMLLSEEEFLRIKPVYVEQVLAKLRELARREAELLFRVHHYHPQVPLPDLSTRLSAVMMHTADAIEAAYDRLESEDDRLIRHLVLDHVPPVLAQAAGERLWTAMPRPYLRWIVAKSLAARIVYREGFEDMESMPTHVIGELAIRYLRLELERLALIDEVDASTLTSKSRIAAVLRHAGILSTMHSSATDQS